MEMLWPNHKMDALREIKEQPCLEGTMNEGYQVPDIGLHSETGYKGHSISNGYELPSGIEIKNEPCCFGISLNEVKTELEEPVVPLMNIHNEVNFDLGYNNDNLMLSGYKVATRAEFKEEHLWEDRTSADVNCWTILSLDSAPLTSNGVKGIVSSVSGIDENHSATGSLRWPTGVPYSDGYDSAGFQNLVFENTNSLRTQENSFEYKRHEGNEAFHEYSYSQKSTEECNTVTQDHAKPFKCSVCGKNFRYSYYLKRHMMIHSGIKPYVCDVCKRRFTQMAHLKNHILLHSGTKPHKCDLCDMSFTQLGNLKKHISTHSGTRPYRCERCEKSFVARSLLSRHMLTHSGTKACNCDVCGKKFKDPSVLTRHKLTHSKTYKSDVCEKSFNRRITLSRHKFALSHT